MLELYCFKQNKTVTWFRFAGAALWKGYKRPSVWIGSVPMHISWRDPWYSVTAWCHTSSLSKFGCIVAMKLLVLRLPYWSISSGIGCIKVYDSENRLKYKPNYNRKIKRYWHLNPIFFCCFSIRNLIKEMLVFDHEINTSRSRTFIPGAPSRFFKTYKFIPQYHRFFYEVVRTDETCNIAHCNFKCW